MALTIEDGSLVSGADSYISPANARAYASKRGDALPADDAACSVLLVKAMDYIEALEAQFKGTRTSTEQELAWPRIGVTINGAALASDAIPRQLPQLQAQLAIDAQSAELSPNTSGRIITRQKVDVLETEYAVTGDGTADFTKARNLLSFLLEDTASSFTAGILRT